jgi:hypothetical protein
MKEVGDVWGLSLDFLLPPRPAVRWLRCAVSVRVFKIDQFSILPFGHHFVTYRLT